MNEACDGEKGIYCGRIGKEILRIKKIISEKREIDKGAGDGIIRRNGTDLFKDDQILRHIYLRVEKSKLVRERLLNLLREEERTNIEAIYQLYGDFDFCVELQGCMKDVHEIEARIRKELKSLGQLPQPPGKLKNPLVMDYLDFHKLYGIERDDIKKGVYFIDFEKANSIGVFVHVNIGNLDAADATAIYNVIKDKLIKRDREAFLYSVSYSEQTSVLWFMLLAECGEYYQLNEVSDIIDDAVEHYGIKKTTYPIAGFIHNDVNNEGFKMAINYKGNGKLSMDGKMGKGAVGGQESADMIERFDVFLAHNSLDKLEVESLNKELQKRGIKTWIDSEQIPPGKWFQDVIQNAVKDVKSAAIIIGRELGRWQIMELRVFVSQCVENSIPLIPVLLPGVNAIPAELVFLNGLSHVSFKSSVQEDKILEKLVWGIKGEKAATQ